MVSCAVALMGVACAEAEREPPPLEATPSPQALALPTPTAERWDSLDAMAAALQEAGVETELSIIGVGNNEETLKDMGTVNMPDGHMNIYLFKNAEQRDLWVPSIASTFEIVYGPNWLVVPFGKADLVRGVFGGTVAGENTPQS